VRLSANSGAESRHSAPARLQSVPSSPKPSRAARLGQGGPKDCCRRRQRQAVRLVFQTTQWFFCLPVWRPAQRTIQGQLGRQTPHRKCPYNQSRNESLNHVALPKETPAMLAGKLPQVELGTPSGNQAPALLSCKQFFLACVAVLTAVFCHQL